MLPCITDCCGFIKRGGVGGIETHVGGAVSCAKGGFIVAVEYDPRLLGWSVETAVGTPFISRPV